MISYSSNGIWKVFQLSGSVFPSSLVVALPCSILAGIIKYLIDEGHLAVFEHEDSILKETQAFSGFSALVGFLVVFRTSQAYSRFWDGSSATHRMRAEWFDACSSLVAFCRHSKAEEPSKSAFQNILVRLFSMLHACALAELEVINSDYADHSQAKSYGLNIIDPSGFDPTTVDTIRASDCKVELIFTWIQFIIVENLGNGVLSIPPPILSRSFQEIANGMVAFHDAIKIAYIPFPFPYAQTCDCLLLIHWMLIPFVTSQWVTKWWWSAVFSFSQVFILWALNFIAVEIENPFGTDDNDLDGEHMQAEMNRQLVLLMQRRTTQIPLLTMTAIRIEDCEDMDSVKVASLGAAWMENQSSHSVPMVATSSQGGSSVAVSIQEFSVEESMRSHHIQQLGHRLPTKTILRTQKSAHQQRMHRAQTRNIETSSRAGSSCSDLQTFRSRDGNNSPLTRTGGITLSTPTGNLNNLGELEDYQPTSARSSHNVLVLQTGRTLDGLLFGEQNEMCEGDDHLPDSGKCVASPLLPDSVKPHVGPLRASSPEPPTIVVVQDAPDDTDSNRDAPKKIPSRPLLPPLATRNAGTNLSPRTTPLTTPREKRLSDKNNCLTPPTTI